ncbi:MAG: hypothetical protein NVSMB32_05710 [Actinomycetota bacterium]
MAQGCREAGSPTSTLYSSRQDRRLPVGTSLGGQTVPSSAAARGAAGTMQIDLPYREMSQALCRLRAAVQAVQQHSSPAQRAAALEELQEATEYVHRLQRVGRTAGPSGTA